MSTVTPMFTVHEVRLARLEARVDAAWKRLRRAMHRQARAGTKITSMHYLNVVGAEKRLLTAVDEWQYVKHGVAS